MNAEQKFGVRLLYVSRFADETDLSDWYFIWFLTYVGFDVSPGVSFGNVCLFRRYCTMFIVIDASV